MYAPSLVLVDPNLNINVNQQKVKIRYVLSLDNTTKKIKKTRNVYSICVKVMVNDMQFQF